MGILEYCTGLLLLFFFEIMVGFYTVNSVMGEGDSHSTVVAHWTAGQKV